MNIRVEIIVRNVENFLLIKKYILCYITYFEIEADWPREAEEKVKEMYDKQLIVLDADDFSDLVIREENTCK